MSEPVPLLKLEIASSGILGSILNIYELNQIFHSQLHVVNKTTILLPTNITLLGPYIP